MAAAAAAACACFAWEEREEEGGRGRRLKRRRQLERREGKGTVGGINGETPSSSPAACVGMDVDKRVNFGVMW